MLGKLVSDYFILYNYLLSATAQGVITQLVSELFAIKASYFGSILSNLAKVLTYKCSLFDLYPLPPNS